MNVYPSPKSDEYNRTIRKLYKESPEKALDYAFKCGENSLYGNAFIEISRKSIDDGVWGSFKGVKREYLKGKNYEFSISDTNPVSLHIFIKDELFTPRWWAR